MAPRIVAVLLGILAGIAVVLLLAFDWSAAVALLGIDKPGMVAILADPVPRIAWTLAAVVSAFAIVALLIALVAGVAETVVARARIDALRHDPALAGRWNPADWRAAFAHTAVRERAEAIVAALLPTRNSAVDSAERRAVADMSLLVDLDKVWLERLALDGPVAPLPNLLLGAGVTLALVRYASGAPGWEVVLAAGVAAWLFIRVLHYFVHLALGIAVGVAVAAATAAVRPLTSVLSLDLIARRAAEERPAAAPGYLVEPKAPEATLLVPEAKDPQLLTRVSEAADRLNDAGSTLVAQVAGQLAELAKQAGQAGAAAAAAPLAAIAGEIKGAVHERERAIESALAEVRAGIEELLTTPRPAAAEPPEPGEGEGLRRALADQVEALRQAGGDVRAGMETVAEPLRATLGALEANERRSAQLLAELLKAVEKLSAAPGNQPAGHAGEPAPPGAAPSPAIAEELRNLLREFDEG